MPQISDNTVLGALLVMSLFFITVVFFAIRKFIIESKRIKEFQKNLKVGDETDQGVVLRIDGYAVYTEKKTRIEYIYPVSENKPGFLVP
jgi:preprotein translocase subunit YajC